jgi:FixJ family two-component response regulator
MTKPFRDQDLLDALHVGLEKSRAWRRESAVISELEERYRTLSASEKETMALIVSGLVTREIARELKLSEITVTVRRGQITRKMRTASMPQLVRMADKLKPDNR